MLKEVRLQLLEAQNRMKQIYDKTHQEREFLPGDWVYLRLQEHRQHSVYRRLNKKLFPKFFWALLGACETRAGGVSIGFAS